jgi:hypothetical protein
MSADTCEGVFAPTLWKWISTHYRLDAVITFAPNASPFPGVDTNAVVFMIRNSTPDKLVAWASCNEAETDILLDWVRSDFLDEPKLLTIHRRLVEEAIATGLSRPPIHNDGDEKTLGDFAYVVRGIATGANEFFFITSDQAKDLNLPAQYLKPAIGRTRDVAGSEINLNTFEELNKAGRPTWLLSLDGTPIQRFPKSVRNYLDVGEAKGLPERPLIASRRPWYRMETRVPPPILFAYLGRRNIRFVRNNTVAVPLTGFLCVYPREGTEKYLESLWNVLSHPQTIAGLSRVGKSYGSGAIKVEPRALEKLPLPKKLMEQFGLLRSEAQEQFSLAYAAST